MAKSANQKLKLLYLMTFLLENTDEEHHVTVSKMIEYLESKGISAERKSIYDDLEALRLFGLDVILERKSSIGYFIGVRDFELAELKLLVDSVQSSKFITQKKTLELIGKLEKLCSRYEAGELHRQVYVANRIKTMNESIYYNIDRIHLGIASDRQIRFRYFEYVVSKERVFRRSGEFYVISPLALTWDDENYYMIGYDAEAGIIKHFRVDKMTDIETVDEQRLGKEQFSESDVAMYSKKVFGMFGGEERKVRLRFKNHLVGAVIDRFGADTIIVASDDGTFTVTVSLRISPQFFAWLCGFGDEAKILEPGDVARNMREYVRKIAAQYEKTN